MLVKEFIKSSMTTDLIANALTVDTPQEIINFIIDYIKADIDIILGKLCSDLTLLNSCY